MLWKALAAFENTRYRPFARTLKGSFLALFGLLDGVMQERDRIAERWYGKCAKKNTTEMHRQENSRDDKTAIELFLSGVRALALQSPSQAPER
jgi:hypothetical protein